MRHQQGITLVELMLAMALSGFAIAAIVMAFRSQNASSLIQETVTDMQQNNSAAMDIMTRELRMAGYDPTESTLPAIIAATSSTFHFTADLTRNGVVTDANENVAYGFKATDDTDGNGVADAGIANLGRNTGGGFMEMAENIEAINFAYAYDSNNDGNLDTYTLTSGPNVGQQRTIWAFPSGGIWFNIDTNGDGVIDASDGPGSGSTGVIAGSSTGTTVNLKDIRAIMIWILARSDRNDARTVNTTTYTVGRQVLTRNDRFYRRLLTSTVTCRNFGL